MRITPRSALITVFLGTLTLLTSGCGTIAGGYRIPDRAAERRSYSSIAGSIEVGRDATIRNADTIAGDIDIGEGSKVRSLDSIAGDIRLAPGVTVDGTVETIAGDIDIARGCTIGGNVESVAGDISITDSVVRGGITLRHSDLKMVRTRVVGVVRVKRPNDDDADPRVTIGPECEVGEVVVDPKATVDLRIHRTAKVGAVKGTQAEYYD